MKSFGIARPIADNGMTLPRLRRQHANGLLQLPAHLTVIAVLTLCMASLGCTYEKVLYDPWKQIEDLSESPDGRGGAGFEDDASKRWAHGFAVLVETLEGAKAKERAEYLADRLQTEAGVTGAWVRDQGAVVQVLAGQFKDPTAYDAQNTLERVRTAILDGDQPYSLAGIIPLKDDAEGEQGLTTEEAKEDAWNAKHYPGMYTLQIGYYDENFGDDFRLAAEKAVRTLRDAGEQAFYYHGNGLSMVTIGLFSDQDFVMQETTPGVRVQAYGPAITAVQKRYPKHLSNGRTIIEYNAGQKTGDQESFIVRIR